jgi:hypothetical protein
MQFGEGAGFYYHVAHFQVPKVSGGQYILGKCSSTFECLPLVLLKYLFFLLQLKTHP